MIETLKTLCALNGVSGDEDAVRDYLRTQAEPYADAIRTDALGNLIVFKRGRKATGSKLLLCAHMDEVGLIVTRATEDGFLKFDFVGGVDRRVVLGKPVELGPDRVPGIVGMKAIHMLTAEERKKVPKTESLYLDIGASDKEEALSKVPLGTYGAFVGEPEELGDGFLKSKAIDDRVGCAILLELLKEDLPLDVTFAFTAQEEVGTRGAFGAAFSVTPEIALVLETTTAADLPEIEGARRVCAPGKGPVISYMDGGTIYDRELFETLRRLAEERNIPWQTKEYIAGGNDARTIQRSKEGVYRRGQRRPDHPALQGRGAGGGPLRRCALSPRPSQRGEYRGFWADAHPDPGLFGARGPIPVTNGTRADDIRPYAGAADRVGRGLLDAPHHVLTFSAHFLNLTKERFLHGTF